MMEAEEILRCIPHRYPLLMVDRVIELDAKPPAIVACKNVTQNEPCFQGHFPGRPVMPGIFLVEALAQTALLCVFGLELVPPDWGFYLAGIEHAKFRRAVVPGDQLRLEAKLIRSRSGYFKAQGSASANGQVAMEAVLTAFFFDQAQVEP